MATPRGMIGRGIVVVATSVVATLLLPIIPNITFGAHTFAVKAAIHAVGYAIIFLAIFWGLSWCRHALPASILLAALLGAVDEWRQIGSPTRSASVSDWAFDALGVLLAAAILRWRRARPRPE